MSIATRHLKNSINGVVSPVHKLYTDPSVHGRMLFFHIKNDDSKSITFSSNWFYPLTLGKSPVCFEEVHKM